MPINEVACLALLADCVYEPDLLVLIMFVLWYACYCNATEKSRSAGGFGFRFTHQSSDLSSGEDSGKPASHVGSERYDVDDDDSGDGGEAIGGGGGHVLLQQAQAASVPTAAAAAVAETLPPSSPPSHLPSTLAEPPPSLL